MKKILLLSILCFIVCSHTQGQTQVINDSVNTELFSEPLLLQHLETLSSDAFEGRRTGTKGAFKAEKYIVNQFVSNNVSPLIINYTQPFSFKNEGKNYSGVNILGLIKGTLYPERYIVLSAHYDHEVVENGQIYNGADDNASGICALFSFIEYFKINPPNHSIILAAFDAEELGLQGSKYFVNHSIVPLKEIMINLNMDMVSRSDKNELFAVGTVFNKTLEDVISSHEYSTTIKLLKGHDQGNWKENWTNSSDHASFHKRGIPFIYFGVEDHEDYHKPTDDFEKIQPEFYAKAVTVIISVFEKIDRMMF